MGIAYNTSIVRDGLVLHLDAANVKSYPGSGTAWRDLSPTKRDVTFYGLGGTTYTNNPPLAPNSTIENVRQFNFDGVNDWGYFSNQFTIPSISSVSAWVKLTDSGVNGILSHCSGGPVGVRYGISSGKMEYYYYSGGWVSTVSNSTVNNNTWKNVVFAKYNTDLKMYINGILDSTVIVPSQSFNIQCIGSGWGPCESNSYGAGTDTYAQVFAGSIGNILIHEKQLSANEVRHNFNALRGRYGV